MSTKKNENILAVGIGLILGNVFSAIIRLIFTGYFDLTYHILWVILSLGVSLALLGWLAEWKGDSLENY